MYLNRTTRRQISRLILGGLLCAVISNAAQAQNSINVEQLQAEGSYLAALEAYNQLPKRQSTTTAMNAAASSAQALSLSGLASGLIDTALKDNSLSAKQRASLLVRRGTIEFQEGRFAVAKIFAQRAEALLEEPSPLRAEAMLLGAQADEATGAYSQAELEYLNALGEVAPDDVSEVYFLVAGVQQRLQKLSEARSSLEQIPLQSPHAAGALLGLAEISLVQQSPEDTLKILEKGKDAFPYEFSGGKALYLALKAAISVGDNEKILAINADMASRFPSSNTWRSLIEAMTEMYFAKQRGLS